MSLEDVLNFETPGGFCARIPSQACGNLTHRVRAASRPTVRCGLTAARLACSHIVGVLKPVAAAPRSVPASHDSAAEAEQSTSLPENPPTGCSRRLPIADRRCAIGTSTCRLVLQRPSLEACQQHHRRRLINTGPAPPIVAGRNRAPRLTSYHRPPVYPRHVTLPQIPWSFAGAYPRAIEVSQFPAALQAQAGTYRLQ